MESFEKRYLRVKKIKGRSRYKSGRTLIGPRILTAIGVLFFCHPSFGQDAPQDLFENFVASKCVVITPIFDPVINSDSVGFPSAPPYNATTTLVEHYRNEAEYVYREMTKIAASFDFDTLEQWAIVGDRVWIVMLSVTASPGAYSPIPADTVVVLPESQRAAGEIYLRITELLQTVSEEEKKIIRPHVDELRRQCI